MNLQTAGEAVAQPEEYALYRWFDVGTPMRPDEFNRQCALDWNEAVSLRNAIFEGEQGAKDEQEVERKIQEMLKNGGRSSTQ